VKVHEEQPEESLKMSDATDIFDSKFIETVDDRRKMISFGVINHESSNLMEIGMGALAIALSRETNIDPIPGNGHPRPKLGRITDTPRL
jgi:hypothetical protein